MIAHSNDKKVLHIAGVGVGKSSLSVTVAALLPTCDLYLGATRVLELLELEPARCVSAYLPAEVAGALASSSAQKPLLLVSGDCGFFSAAQAIQAALPDYELQFHPGISSLSEFCARFGLAWQDFVFCSLHGRQAEPLAPVRRNRYSFFLAGTGFQALAASLQAAGFGELLCYLAEDLGLASEYLWQGSVADLAQRQGSKLAVLLVHNPQPDQRLRLGIADEAFVRGSLPMSKAAVRAVAVSQLEPSPSDIIYDIGSGTASVAIELALAAYKGTVYAIDKEPEAGELCRQNALRFQVGNIHFCQGQAPAILASLPAADAAFIGGSGGDICAIISCLRHRNPRIRIVATAICLSTIAQVAAYCAANELPYSAMQLQTAKATGAQGMLLAQNPIFILRLGAAHE